MDRVILDANVLIGALLNAGVNRKLLTLARTGLFFEAIISETVIIEFIINCRRGIGKKNKLRVYTEDEIDRFFATVEPLLSHENIVRVGIGKDMYRDAYLNQQIPVQQYLYALFYEKTGEKKDQLLQGLDEYGKDVSKVDPGDLHIMYAAIEHDCNVIVTHNTDDFPKVLGAIEVFRPGIYYDFITKNQR